MRQSSVVGLLTGGRDNDGRTSPSQWRHVPGGKGGRGPVAGRARRLVVGRRGPMAGRRGPRARHRGPRAGRTMMGGAQAGGHAGEDGWVGGWRGWRDA
jgi:hypothetical protein